MGLFSKNNKIFPVELIDGTKMNLTLDSPLPDEFIENEFVDLREKDFDQMIFDWHPDLVKNMTSQMYLSDYFGIAQEISNSYLVVAPFKVSNRKIKLKECEGVGVLTSEALCFFWESTYRFNLAVLAHVGTRSIVKLSDYSFSSVNEDVVCRRSPAPELIRNEDWIFEPSLTDYGSRNRQTLQLFFTLQKLQDENLN